MEPGGLSDADLTRRCRQADPVAWRQLTRRFSPQVYRLAVRMLGRQEEAEDACQEVFLRIHKSFGSFDATRPLSPWMSRITYNVCLRRLQTSKRQPASEISAKDVDRISAGASPEQQAAGRESGDRLEQAMRSLSSQDRALLVMRYREGLSDAEVAEAVEMPVNTVKTRIFRARKKLRDFLTPVFEEG